MSAMTVALQGGGATAALVGGKGHSLDKLLAIGAPVPPTGVITTAGYRAFIEGSGLRGLTDELASAPPPRPEDFDAETGRIDAAFLDAPMPPELRDDIVRLAASVRDHGRLAVRSSATAEDMTSASFAGQYRSFLELGDDDEVLRAVRLTWSSLWLPAPRAYRRFRGIAEDDLAMAVIVMRLVEATHAGVVFTLDPGAAPGHLRIEVVEGLGEKLVSGAVTPEAHVVARRGTRPFPQPLAPVLERLSELALEVEERLGGPQDIEWAYGGDELYLVQARPITAAPSVDGADDDGFDTVPVDGCTYTSAGIGEMLPGVLPPLVWTINGPLLEEAFRRLFDALGLPIEVDRPSGVIGRFRGRAALNLDMLKSVATNMPGGSGAELERQYFGEVISETSGSDERKKRFDAIRSLVPAVRAMQVRRRLATEAQVVTGAIDRVVELDVDIARLDVAHLLAYRRRVRELAARAIATETAVAAAAAAAYRGLEMFLEPHIGGEAPLMAQRLTAGGIHACGASTALDVCDLVAGALEEPQLADVLAGAADPTETIRILESSESGRSFLEDFNKTIRRAGSTAVFGGPTWEEAKGVGWSTLKQAIEVEKAKARPSMATDRAALLAEVEGRLSRNWRWRATRVMTGQLIDVRKRLLRRLVADSVRFLGLREITKAAVLRLGGESRRITLRMAALLVERGALDDATDIDYLADDEVEDALAGATLSEETLANRRRAVATAEAAGPLPQRFTGRPAAIIEEREHGDVLKGWGASPGRFRGPARVVRDLASSRLQRGDVLVAQSTDPSWTPLFLTAGAIVVEQGGPLSHAAIVARELGLPAVLNAGGAAARLAAGEEVTVDGTEGTIVIHSSGEEGAPRGAAA